MLGDEKIAFQKADINEIKKFDVPSLKLMGFKPRSRVKAYHNIRSSYFLYPNDDVNSNASSFFSYTHRVFKDHPSYLMQ